MSFIQRWTTWNSPASSSALRRSQNERQSQIFQSSSRWFLYRILEVHLSHKFAWYTRERSFYCLSHYPTEGESSQTKSDWLRSTIRIQRTMRLGCVKKVNQLEEFCERFKSVKQINANQQSVVELTHANSALLWSDCRYKSILLSMAQRRQCSVPIWIVKYCSLEFQVFDRFVSKLMLTLWIKHENLQSEQCVWGTGECSSIWAPMKFRNGKWRRPEMKRVYQLVMKSYENVLFTMKMWKAENAKLLSCCQLFATFHASTFGKCHLRPERQ